MSFWKKIRSAGACIRQQAYLADQAREAFKLHGYIPDLSSESPNEYVQQAGLLACFTVHAFPSCTGQWPRDEQL